MANTISDVNSVMTLTNNGLKLYNKVQLGICGIEITRVSIGDGELSPGESAEDLVAPKHELINVLTDITSYATHDDGQTCLKIAIGTSVEDYYMREINVWAADPDDGEILYAYCNFGDYADYVKTYGGGAVTKQEYDLYIATGRATEIEVDITSATQITRADLEEHTLNEENPHHVTAAQVGFTNKSVLDLITSALFSAWQAAADARHSHGNKSILDGITSALVTSWNSAVSHISNKSNPHGVTKAQVGLGNVTNESKATMFTSPTFTGMPKAPTAAAGTNNTQLATTAFVNSAIDAALSNIIDYIDITVDVTFEPGGDYSPGRWTITSATGRWHVGNNSNIVIDVDETTDEFDDMIDLYGYVSNGAPHIGLSVDGSSYTKRLTLRSGGTYTIRLYKSII